jgi:hypothetical protein
VHLGLHESTENLIVTKQQHRQNPSESLAENFSKVSKSFIQTSRKEKEGFCQLSEPFSYQ